MIAGPAGPISVHTPEICYSSRAYSIQEPRVQTAVSDKNGRTHSFWSVSFRYELKNGILTLKGFPTTNQVSWGVSGFIVPDADITFEALR